uniref:ATP synthase F0 subunit 8 n=1 Tax=Romanomermis culicivorax TaxID=13658 RepID=A0A915KGM4_ROMCU
MTTGVPGSKAPFLGIQTISLLSGMIKVWLAVCGSMLFHVKAKGVPGFKEPFSGAKTIES